MVLVGIVEQLGGNGGRTGAPEGAMASRSAATLGTEPSSRGRSHRPSRLGLRTGLYQLPPDIEDFTGRDDAMQELQGLFAMLDPTPANVVVSSIAGRAGVGKTALATRVAHRLRSSFPDGQLYVNLRGAEAKHMKSVEALGELLFELGVARGAIRDELDERTQQYRDQLADRRILACWTMRPRRRRCGRCYRRARDQPR